MKLMLIKALFDLKTISVFLYMGGFPHMGDYNAPHMGRILFALLMEGPSLTPKTQ